MWVFKLALLGIAYYLDSKIGHPMMALITLFALFNWFWSVEAAVKKINSLPIAAVVPPPDHQSNTNAKPSLG